MAKELDKFPNVENVHEVLGGLSKLFADRNALLHSMFREDKYKEFLLAENIQSLVEADKRDDSANSRIKADLANGYEVLKARTTMKKFANFLSPGAVPPMDLSEAEDFDEKDEMSPQEEEQAEREDKEVVQGEKGEKGDPGDTTVVSPPSQPTGFDHIATPGGSQAPSAKLAKGGMVSPMDSPMGNFLNAGARPEGKKSSTKSLESLGLVGKKNVGDELTEDLGLDQYKKALGDAMALPMKAVAAGLSGLLSKLNLPGPEFEAAKKQIDSVSQAFSIPKPSAGPGSSEETNVMNESNQETLIAQGGPMETIKNFFGLAKDKDHSVSDQTPMGAAVTGLQKRRQMNEQYMQMLNAGGPSSEHSSGSGQEPLDNLSTSVNTTNESVKNTMTGMIKGAASWLGNNTVPGMVIKSGVGLISKMLGGITPAAEGSQYTKQDINSLSNQVIMGNESMMASKTTHISTIQQNMMKESQARMAKIISQMNKQQSPGINETSPVPAQELKISKYLTNSILITPGGETPLDVL